MECTSYASIVCHLLHYGQIKYRVLQVGTALACNCCIYNLLWNEYTFFLFQSRVTCIVHIHYTFFIIILLIWLFASVGSLQIVWEPYKNYLGSLPAYCTAGQHIWRSIVPLLHFWVVERHHPERVL